MVVAPLAGTMDEGTLHCEAIQMGYVCEWAVGHSVYLENLASQTRVTVINSSPGQQQQATSSIQTGNWTAPPEVLRSTIGVVVKLFTTQGEQFIQIQGTSVSTFSEAPLGETQPIPVKQFAVVPDSYLSTSKLPSMAPMPSLTPLRMGDMQMDQTAMTMQMGEMRLEMPIAPSLDPSGQSSAAEPSESVGQRNFCSQCGSPIKPSDRFCASCGHQLSESVKQ